MTDYNDGKWHGWNGGACPVHPRTKVHVLFESANGRDDQTANQWRWGGEDRTPIAAFRVIEEYKEPREFWVFENGHGDWIASATYRHAAIHVREVLS